ncbi:MAG TPA: sulfatase-like hydrolase/transferase, partial [Candidatus Latescibacteria bacterium]|nr:sulfatase-like hydrolase/transferase [Candidatus Latescibacterota bacterium]
MPDHPNIFVIVSDTFRPDHIGINGAGFAETPELDDFLRRGVTFDNALVSSFPTIPMRTDWWTGRFGHPRYGW